jgi:hypothetical protein
VIAAVVLSAGLDVLRMPVADTKPPAASRLYVGVTGLGFIQPYINVYHVQQRFPQVHRQIQDGLEFGATQLAIDAREHLFVADPDVGVLEYSADGNDPVNVIPNYGVFDGDDFGVALDSTGTLYVIANYDFENGTLEVFRPPHKKPLEVLTGLVNPFNVAVDSSQDVFIVESTGTYSGQIAEVPAGSQAPQILSLKGIHDPGCIAFSPGGDMFVSDGGIAEILAFHPGSTTSFMSISPPEVPGSLAFDLHGDLFVEGVDEIEMYRPMATQPHKYVRAGLAQYGTGPIAVFPQFVP